MEYFINSEQVATFIDKVASGEETLKSIVDADFWAAMGFESKDRIIINCVFIAGEAIKEERRDFFIRDPDFIDLVVEYTTRYAGDKFWREEAKSISGINYDMDLNSEVRGDLSDVAHHGMLDIFSESIKKHLLDKDRIERAISARKQSGSPYIGETDEVKAYETKLVLNSLMNIMSSPNFYHHKHFSGKSLLETVLTESELFRDYFINNPEVVYENYCNIISKPFLLKMLKNKFNFPVERFDFFKANGYSDRDDMRVYKQLIEAGCSPKMCDEFVCEAAKINQPFHLRVVRELHKRGIIDASSPELLDKIIKLKPNASFLSWIGSLNKGALDTKMANGNPLWWSIDFDLGVSKLEAQHLTYYPNSFSAKRYQVDLKKFINKVKNPYQLNRDGQTRISWLASENPEQIAIEVALYKKFGKPSEDWFLAVDGECKNWLHKAVRWVCVPTSLQSSDSLNRFRARNGIIKFIEDLENLWKTQESAQIANSVISLFGKALGQKDSSGNSPMDYLIAGSLSADQYVEGASSTFEEKTFLNISARKILAKILEANFFSSWVYEIDWENKSVYELIKDRELCDEFSEIGGSPRNLLDLTSVFVRSGAGKKLDISEDKFMNDYKKSVVRNSILNQENTQQPAVKKLKM